MWGENKLMRTILILREKDFPQFKETFFLIAFSFRRWD